MKKLVVNLLDEPQTWTISLGKRFKLQNMDTIFGTWNIRSLYRAGSLMIVSKELSKHMLDFMGVQEVRWDRCDTEQAGEYTLFYGMGN
jgi:hypothetical protein